MHGRAPRSPSSVSPALLLRHLPERHRLFLRRRGASLTLTLVAHLLLAWLLLHLAPSFTPQKKGPTTNSFSLSPDTEGGEAPAPTKRPSAEKSSPSAGAPPASKAPTPPTPVEPKTKPAEEAPATPWLWGDKSLFEASDIARIPNAGPVGRGAGAAQGDDSGADSVAAYGPGAGPGGQRLYKADWLREPTDAELNGYLPRNIPPNAWAEIACQTAPDNRVENCRVLGDSHMGSGIARTLREAAWQFRIRPPRIGGKPMIGAWVRIHFDFTRKPGE